MDVTTVIKDFDDFLSSKNSSFSGIIIGGGALALMGITTRGTKDIDDCIKMNPSQSELLEILNWVKCQDQNPQWPAHVEKCFARLAQELGYAL